VTPPAGPPAPAKPFTGRPLLAATLIVVDTNASEPRILMGRRRPDAIFLPDKMVFPGGRVEASDGDLELAGAFSAHDQGRLLRGVRHPDAERNARAFVTAAVRETFEETGYLVAVNGVAQSDVAQDWPALVRAGIRPDRSRLRFVARAITPPGRPRRYDTRFFMATADAVRMIAPRTDGELSEIGWFGFDAVSAHDLPSITRMVLSDLKAALNAGPEPEIPFYYWRSGAFRRAVLIERAAPA